MKKDRVYTDQQRLFLDALIPCQGDIRAAMDIAGYAKTTSERYVVDTLYEEIVEMTNKFLAGNAIRAAVKMTEVLVDPAAVGNANKLNAAKEILDRGGVTKKGNDEIKVPVGHGLLILPAKQSNTPVFKSDNKPQVVVTKQMEEDFGPFDAPEEPQTHTKDGERLIAEHRLIPMTEKEDF